MPLFGELGFSSQLRRLALGFATYEPSPVRGCLARAAEGFIFLFFIFNFEIRMSKIEFFFFFGGVKKKKIVTSPRSFDPIL